MLAQPHEAYSPFIVDKKLVLGKDNPLRVRTHRYYGPLRILLAIFVRSAKLKVSISQKPRPPTFFARANTSHLLQLIFLPSDVPPYEKYAIMAFTSEHHVLGRLNTLITKERMTVITALLSTTFPASFRVFVLHPFILFLILLLIYPKASFFDHPHTKERPRYFPGSEVFAQSLCNNLRLHP